MSIELIDRTHHHPYESLIRTLDNRDSMDRDQGHFGDLSKSLHKISFLLSVLLLTSLLSCAQV